MTTDDKTTAIYVRTAVHNPGPDDALAAQEERCCAYAAEFGWPVTDRPSYLRAAHLGRRGKRKKTRQQPT